MAELYAMQRANGDWYAMDDRGGYRVPIFASGKAAMLARSRDTRMECFRPALLDTAALAELTNADEGKGCYWLISDPERKLSRGRPIDHPELISLVNGSGRKGKN